MHVKELLFGLILCVSFCVAAPILQGAPAFMGSGTYPRTIRLNSGQLLGGYTSFPASGTKALTTVISTNNGASWSALGEIARGTGDIDNIALIQLGSGRVLAAFRNHDSTTFRITVCKSDDNGKSWTFLSQAAQEAKGVHGLWEPFFRIARDGRVQLYYSRENASNDQDSLMRVSGDGGATWSGAITVSGGSTTGRDGMIGVSQYVDGSGVTRLMCVFETTEDGPFAIKAVTSSDDGNSWGNRQLVYRAPNGRNAGAPQIATAGNQLVVTFMTDEDGAGGQWPNAASVKLVTSVAGGGFGSKTTVGGIQSSWAGVMALDGSNVLVAVDHGGSVAQKISV